MSGSSRIRIMGIINVTPDSFSDGGANFDHGVAVDHALKLVEDGADIIDVGGESTRPYAQPVEEHEEINRVIPVISALRARSEVAISIDTTKASVARRALAAGATMINDISALRADPEMIATLKQGSCEVVIMHMQGSPATMQDAPHYDSVIDEIIDFFRDRLEVIGAAGIDLNRVIIDPGIGFGKTLAHNLSIIKNLSRFAELGRPLLLGHSRKRFMGELTGLEAHERDTITAVISALCFNQGVDIFRVHDVAATYRALKIAAAISAAA
jgi:dihydropteroate synthase